MRAFITFSFLLIFTCISYSQPGWIAQSSGTINYLYSVYFIDANTGWVVGQNGTILKTTNGGLNWSAQSSVHTGFFYSVYFITSSTGWAAGQSGTIMKTTNAGVNWISQTSGSPSNYLYSVFFTDINTGYIVGSSGLILKTTNSGVNWIQQSSGVTNTLSCVYFPPSGTSMTGFAVGGTATSGTILKTSNAGLNWFLDTVGTNWFFGVHFADIDLGWTVGFNGVIYATTDAGANWLPQSSGTSNRLVAVHFPNYSTGWSVGYSGTIVKTTNGGSNWFTQACPTINNLWSVYFIDENTGWAAGWNGTILHTTNGGVTSVNKISSEIPSSFQLYQNYPNPFNPSTHFEFRIADFGLVKLTIYDVLGHEITAIVNERLSPGTYEVEWNAESFPSGVYFYKLSAISGADDYSETRKMILLK